MMNRIKDYEKKTNQYGNNLFKHHSPLLSKSIDRVGKIYSLKYRKGKSKKPQIKNHQICIWWRRWESNPRPETSPLKRLRA